jgi:hypothetical protein
VVEVEHQNCLLTKLNVNVETKSFKKMTNNHQKHSRTPPYLDMFLMVKIKDFKIVDVKMQAVIE